MKNLLDKAKLFVNHNAATILTIASGFGVVATTIMAIKATPKAVSRIHKAEGEKGATLTKLEVVKETATVYIPTALVGASTIACIFGANILNKRQQAGLMSAYALLDSSFIEYRDKIRELYGDETDEAVTKEIAKDHYKDFDISVSEDNELFYDAFTGQYYQSTKEKVMHAEYILNRELQTIGEVPLSLYYELLGIECDCDEVLGWSVDVNIENYCRTWVDFDHTKVVMDDGLECTVVTMWITPYADFNYII